jgi:uncharacterized protein
VVLVACSRTPEGPKGFATVGATGSGNPLCLWLADTAAKQELGLMDVGSVGKASGMVFRFGQPTTVSFYMYRTVMALTVVFLDATGLILESQDMAPCPDKDPAKCTLYRPSEAYTDAIEVPEGAAARLGLTVGTRVNFQNQC